MKQRTISAIVLLVILIGCLLISTRLFGLLMMVVAILGFNELFDIRYSANLRKYRLIKILGIISLILFGMVFSLLFLCLVWLICPKSNIIGRYYV